MQVEKNGKPGVYFASSNFIKDAMSASADWGMPGLRVLSVPSREWYTYRRTVEEIRPTVAKLLDNIIDLLTRPLTEEEARPKQREPEIPPPIMVTAYTYEAAVEII